MVYKKAQGRDDGFWTKGYESGPVGSGPVAGLAASSTGSTTRFGASGAATSASDAYAFVAPGWVCLCSRP